LTATQNSKRITSAFSSGKRSTNEKEKTLSELFQAPLDIMTQTGFEEVLDSNLCNSTVSMNEYIKMFIS